MPITSITTSAAADLLLSDIESHLAELKSLQALVDLGGRSELHRVLERVHEMMKGQLNEHALALLPSDGVTPRWRNTAQGARNSLREEGLIRDDTPRAVWEISEKGRQWLAGQQKTAVR